MKISARLRAVMIAAIDDTGGVSDFAKKVGLSPATISRYRGGQIKSFSDEAWNKIRPIIASYSDFSVELHEQLGKGVAGLSVDQQLLLKKYTRLKNEQKIRLAEFMDELLMETRQEEAQMTCKAAENPA